MKGLVLILGFLLGIFIVSSMLTPTIASSRAYDTTVVHSLNGAGDVESLIASGKKTYILYHASWCHHCKVLKPQFEDLNAEFDDAVFAECECAKHHDVPQKMKIPAFPCIRKYEGGKQVGEMTGARKDKTATREALKQI